MLAYPILSIFPALLLVAALSDITSFRIPNWIPASMAAAFVPAAIASGMPFSEIGLSLGIGFAALIVGMALFGFRLVGGGDAKLVAAAALWVGYDALFAYLIYVGLIGGIFSLALLMFRKAPLPAVAYGQEWLTKLHSAEEGIPYGVALAGAGFLIYQQTAIFTYLLS